MAEFSKVSNLLGKSFRWVSIPAGSVTILGQAETYLPETTMFDVPAFEIAKYPITVGHYRYFIADGGYARPEFWTENGFRWRSDWGILQPDYWDDTRFNVPDQPVIGVSWHEAVAFCLWLQDRTSEPVILPTEVQWQRAAQGDDDRLYPWGDETPTPELAHFDPRRGQPMPVDAYPSGASPFGVFDMAGNVWEWCVVEAKSGQSDFYATDYMPMMVRGGVLLGDDDQPAPVTYRYSLPPHDRLANVGFRIARI